MLVVDGERAPVWFGSRDQSKRELAAEIASVLAFSRHAQQRQGRPHPLQRRGEKFIPPRKGRSHVLRVIREVFVFRAEAGWDRT